MSRIGLSNSNREWTISNYGTSYSPNGGFVIADETAALVRLVIDTSGNIGIKTGAPIATLDLAANPSILLEGNSNDWGYKLTVTDYGAANVPLIISRRYSAADYETARFDQNGNMGIGITNPTFKLEVATGSGAYDTAFNVRASTHATSRRAALCLGNNWLVLQDSSGDGIKDFSIYDGIAGAQRFQITPSGTVYIPGYTTFNSGLRMGNGFNAGGYTRTQLNNAMNLDGQGASAFAWNYSSGGGELDLFINRNGGNSGGFKIYDFPNTTGNPNLLAFFSNYGTAELTIGPVAPLSAAGYGWITVSGSSGGGVLSLLRGSTEYFRVQGESGATYFNNPASTPFIFMINNNTERMRLKENGNLGIGTSSPNALVHINSPGGWGAYNYGKGLYITTEGGASNPAIAISDYNATNNWGIINASGKLFFATAPGITDGTTTTTTCVALDRNGGVGIGTESPNQALQVQSNGTGLGIRTNFTSTALYAGNGLVATGPSASGNYGGAAFYYYNTASDGSRGAMGISAFDYTGITFQRSLAVYDLYYNYWSFYSGGNETIRLAANNNVGIGTTTPSVKLDVNGQIRGYAAVGALVASATGSQTSMQFNLLDAATDQKVFEFCNFGGTFTFRTVNDAYSAAAEIMTVSRSSSYNISQVCFPNGNVGIGTTSTAAKLDVYGTIRSGNGGTDPGTGAALYFVGSGNYQTVVAGAEFAIHTGANSGRTEKMRIDSSGNLGIGTTTPWQKLSVYGTGTAGDVTTARQISIGTGNTYALHMGYIQSASAAAFVGVLQALDNGSGTYLSLNPSGGNVGIGTLSPAYTLQVNGSFAATTKSFVIDHPIKEGMKLRYGSLEGPENGVYIRGKLKNESIIELPDYWVNLIDVDTITVNLTPYGSEQNIFVENVSNTHIHLNKSANCFFMILAERKDVDKLIVEFEANNNE
jgi:hypothetical protein